jgi:hypothetical protein
MKTQKTSFASIRPTTGWKLTFEGMIDGRYIRTYRKGTRVAKKDLTNGLLTIKTK